MKNYEELVKVFPQIERKVDLSKYSTFKIGGEADLFIEIHTTEEMVTLINKINQLEIPYLILGGGSNVLISDEGFRGVVIKMKNDFFEQDGEILKVGAGINLSWLVKKAEEVALLGLECCVGIPGTLGGAIVGNAGSKDLWIDNIIEKVEIINENGNLQTLTKKECLFGYRTSRFKNNQEIILSAFLKMEKGEREEIKTKMEEFLKKRKEQPSQSSAGSIFKNPEGESAGRLIDEAGLKGTKIGDAQISESHANFIVNLGKARAEDVLKLISLAKEKVKEKFKIDLELEIKII